MKTTPIKVKATVQGRGGKHMGHPGKPVTIQPKHYVSKGPGAKKFPC